MPTWVNASANEGILILQSRIEIEPLHACWPCLTIAFSNQLSCDWNLFEWFAPTSSYMQVIASLINFCRICSCWTLCGEVSNDRPKVVNATVEELEAARSELKARMRWKWRKCFRNAGAVTPVLSQGLIAKLNKGKADKEMPVVDVKMFRVCNILCSLEI